MQQPYSEKEVLADALTAEKTATDHYNTFANECVHENVRNAILDCLDKEHAIQQDVFNIMHGKGYYKKQEFVPKALRAAGNRGKQRIARQTEPG